MLRFIHSSDLHLGKRFGNFSGDVPSRLREARHNVLGTLAQRARDKGAGVILLAGDTFDTETPAPDVLRQAITEMRHHSDLRWVILPGNHDSLQASELWSTISADTPPNLVLARDVAPITLAPGVILLPAPCTTRRPGRDLTEWMDACPTEEGVIRLGLAHGAVSTFSEDMRVEEVIAIDRAKRAGLAYLALGDWHGALEVSPRTWYSGTPEQDRFKHDRMGEALFVTLESATATPIVETIPTASFSWRTFNLHLLDGDDPSAVLAAQLPAERERRHMLAQLVIRGHSRLAQIEALNATVEAITPDFAYLEQDRRELSTVYDVTDLDEIDRGGALREAAHALLLKAQDDTLSATDRETASAALSRLYSYAQKVAA
jgi:DNA repair exonuclease SbcCD nuclease subunit